MLEELSPISRSTRRRHSCNNMLCFGRNLWQYQPSNPTRKFQPPQRRHRNKAYSRESISRPTSPRTSVFLEAIFSRNGRKICKISSKNNPRVVLFQVDYDYCLERNNRNSTGWHYLCIQWRKVEFRVAHGKLKFRAQNAHVQLTTQPL